jgi:ferredoxin
LTRKLLLSYSVEKAEQPILMTVMKETGLAFNILYAELGPSGGEILISVEAPDEDVNRVADLFRERGVRVKELKQAIQLDRDSCFDCGACLSLCPSGALSQTEDGSVEINEDKCVYCELCVPSCPVKALRLSKL